MDISEHKFEGAKVVCAWCGVGGAKLIESLEYPLGFFMGLSLTDWAAFAALVYSGMQITLLLPRFCRTVKGWFTRANPQ